MTDRASGAHRRRQLVVGLVTLVTLVVVFAGVLPQLGDYGEAWDAVRSMSGSAVVLLALATIANILIYPWPYQAAAIGLTYRPSFRVSQTSFAISNGVPGGGALSVAVQYRMLGDYGFGPDAATAAVGINAVWGVLVKVSSAVVSLALLIVVGETQAWVVPAFLIGFVLVGSAIGLLVALFHSEGTGHRIGEWANRVINWVAGLLGKEEAIDVEAKLLEFRASTHDVLKRRVTSISVANVVVQFLSFVVFFVALRGIEGQASMKTTAVVAFAAFSIGRLGDFVPLTPGGLGTVDALITGLLVGFGTNESYALAATLVWRAATYFPQIFIGLGTYLLWRHRGRRADRTPHA
jgi:uncharacterized protein (TIRG00374 family)